MSNDGALHDILRFESQLILIGCDFIPQKRVLAAIAYFDAWCPETLPLIDEKGIQIGTIKVPEQHQWKPVFTMATSVNDDLQFEVF